MEITSINTESLSRMFLAGAKNLDAKKEWINELNVFPVPDGDTGTNMSMTIMSAAREVGALSNPTMKEHEYDNYFCSKRSCCCGETGDERSCKSNFFRFPSWGKR